MSAPTITLTHHEMGPIEVTIADEATFYLCKRHWYCPEDPELGTFSDADFQETKDEIDGALESAEEVTL